MGLGINTEAGGDFVPFLKYDARAGRWFRKGDRDKGEQGPIDVTNNFAAIFDLETIEAGWLHFPTGAAPIAVTRPIAEGIPPRPAGADFKQGFRMMAALPTNLGGGVYEVMSSAKAFISAVDALHTAYSNAPEAKAGKLPVVAMTGTTMIETNGPKGVTRNYQPVLTIQNWVARPASMPAKAFEHTGRASDAAAASGSAPVAQPANNAAVNDATFG